MRFQEGEGRLTIRQFGFLDPRDRLCRVKLLDGSPARARSRDRTSLRLFRLLTMVVLAGPSEKRQLDMELFSRVLAC